MSPLRYRPEIDGLRAIAVSAVVLYHAGLGGAGFVGVDVFFVISGYLITALLLREHLSTGRIDLLDFYARRVRRIFPAAAVVILAVLGGAWLLLPEPGEVYRSAAAAAGFVANVFFQLATGGYFHSDSAQMPLLHLWSLSVEEQFYVLWPALLIVLLRAGLQPRRAIGVLALGSVALAELWLRSDPSAAFYQMPARFWELAAGGLIAATPGRGLPSWTIPAGIMLTLVACALPLGHFPGVGALPAVAGATLVIAAVHGGNSNALLASRPMVGVGLISYSLYLWHWPLLAFDRLLRLGPTPLEVRVMLVALAVLLAVASYRYVETPLRRPWATSRRTVAAGFGLMAVLACGAWAARPSPVIVTAENFIARCAYMPMESLDKFPKAACSPTTGTKLTLWGDSMALAFQPGMALLDPKLGTFIRAGCPPAISFSDRRKATVQRDLCTGFQAKVVPLLRGDTLILAARWQIYPGIEAEMARTLAKVAPQFRRVLILGPTPSLRDDAPKCLAIGDPLACAIPRAEFQALTGQILAGLEAAAKPWPNVTVLDPGAYFCPTDQCTASRDGFPLYSDGFHPSRQAAEGYARQLRLGP